MAASLSRKVEDSINNFFSMYMWTEDSIDNKNVFNSGTMNKYFVIGSSANREVPTCCFASNINKIVSEQGSRFYIPLHDCSSVRKSYKTAHMVFNNLVSKPSRRGVLTRIRTTDGEVYYGSFGVLMDSRKNPLMVSSLSVNKAGANYNVEELILYINPVVFTRTGMLDKFIRDKVIPYVLGTGVQFENLSRFNNIRDNLFRKRDENLIYRVHPKIVISDTINKFFSCPRDYGSIVSDEILACIDDFMEFIS